MGDKKEINSLVETSKIIKVIITPSQYTCFGFACVQYERRAGHSNQELLANCIPNLQVLVGNYVLKVVLSI